MILILLKIHIFDWHPNCHWTIASTTFKQKVSNVFFRFLMFVLNTDSLSPFHPADPSLSEAVQYFSSRQRQHPPGHWRWSYGNLACCSLRPHTDAGQRPVRLGQRERLSTHHLAVGDDPFSSLLPSVVVGLWSLKLILPVCLYLWFEVSRFVLVFYLSSMTRALFTR